MFRPPYGSTSLTEVEGNRKRPDTFTIFQCGSTGWYCALHSSGKYYPLSDRTDKDADIVQRVVDGHKHIG